MFFMYSIFTQIVCKVHCCFFSLILFVFEVALLLTKDLDSRASSNSSSELQSWKLFVFEVVLLLTNFEDALLLTKDLDSTSSSNSSSELKSWKLFVFEVALLLTTVLAFRAFRTASSEYKLSVVGDDLSFFTFCFFVRGPPSFED